MMLVTAYLLYAPSSVTDPQVDAWQVCHELLNGPDSPMEARLFASQTFRTKVRKADGPVAHFADPVRPERYPVPTAISST